jgi:hypothetical protein
MFRLIAMAAGVALLAAVALAAADIPTRYVGSFPSTARNVNIHGTFTGKTLALQYTFRKGQELVPVTARYSCFAAPPNKSHCSGTFRTPNGVGQGEVSITWSNGRPVHMQMSGRM